MANQVAGDIVNSPGRGRLIQDYRCKMHLTQDELSLIMRLRRETISRIENGKVTPTLAFIHVFSGVMALMEAVKTFRSQGKGIEYPYFSRIGAELGVPQDRIMSIIDLAIQSFDEKRRKAICNLS
ncbi:helix-turn-helix transcriptional regulator [Methanocella arvoryzae]|nr:helix-turn-helix transcriptional regulator [Methanocella arvoryzae]